MTDYFDRIELRLLDAVTRRAERRHGPLRDIAARLRRMPRGFALISALLVVGSSAAAAVLLGQPSAGLSGRVPRAVLRPPGGGAPIPYQVFVAPSLTPGDAGWAVGVELGSRRLAIPPGLLSGQYPSRFVPLVWNFGSFQPYPKGGTELPSAKPTSVAAILTAPDVVAVRFDKKIIRARTAPGLPVGDRIVVFFAPPSLLDGTAPLEPVGVPTVIALGQNGRRIAISKPPASARDPLGAQVRSWGPLRLSGPGEGGSSSTRPLAGTCELAQSALPGLVAQSGSVISALDRLTDAEGEVLESCLETVYSFQHSTITVSLLANAVDPGSHAGPIPNATAVRSDPGFANAVLGGAPGGITGEIVSGGKAWLVAEGGGAVSQRIEVLRALHVTRLDLGPLQLPASAHALLRTEACLRSSGVSASPTGSATNYPYMLSVGSLDANWVGFYDTVADAQLDLRNQQADAKESGAALVTRDGTTTIAWAIKPTQEQKARLERCLP
jgi:hypothetical protein